MRRRSRVTSVTVTMMLVVSAYTSISCSSSESNASSAPPASASAAVAPISKAIASDNFRTVFADIAAKITPSVVSVILTKIDTETYSQNPFYNFFSDSFMDNPFQFFFGQPQQRGNRGKPPVQKREFRQQALGSGVIVSEDGYILTNYHVVSGANEINVKLSDERSFDAKIIGTDSLSDVAVIKIKEKVNHLPIAELGDATQLRPGDWALAIGNPFSLTSTVTLGIVSALGREVGNPNLYQSYIQTDAAINPGNSGGALVNIDGKVIGINTMIYTETGGFMGIGFAIPINMAQKVMDDLIHKGKVTRGWIGISIQNINEATREALGLKERKGVLVADVYKGQPADKAGIRRGDVIVSVGGKDVDNPNQLRNTVADLSPDKAVPVVIIRNGKEQTLSITPRERNEKEIAALSRPESKKAEEAASPEKEKRLGFSVANITVELRKKYGIDEKTRGVVIETVDQMLADARAGLKEGDVIEQVKVKNSDFQTVTTVKEFDAVAKGLKKGDSIMLLVARGETTFFIAFTLT